MVWNFIVPALIGGAMSALSRPKAPTYQAPPQEQAMLPYMQEALPLYKDAITGAMNQGPYSGATYAPMSGLQQSNLNNYLGYLSGQAGTANNISNMGQQLAINNTGAYQGAINQLVNFQSGLTNVGQNIADASAYAFNPMTSSIIQNAVDASNKVLGRQQAGLDVSASPSGNLNSSRTGALEANLISDAQDRVANLTADVYGNQYNQGLSTAMQARNQAEGRNLSALNNYLSATGQAMGTGVDLMGTGLQMGTGLMDKAINVGAMQQGERQNVLDANMADYERKRMDPVNMTGAYLSSTMMQPRGQWQAPQPSMFQRFLGGASAGLGFGNQFPNMFGNFGFGARNYGFNKPAGGYGPYQNDGYGIYRN